MFDSLSDLIGSLQPYIEIIRLFITLGVSLIIFIIILKIIKRSLLKKAKTKKQYSNVATFIDLLKYLFAFFLILIAIISYSGRWGDLGFIAGLLTVAIGWALQKPISSVFAWIIIITRRPFHIGDRILIADTKGDITDIKLTHIFLDEISGTIDGEERSGRVIMIPTYIIFEDNIINYTHKSDIILDEVKTSITYESNLEQAEMLVIDSVKKIIEKYWTDFPNNKKKEPYTRLKFMDSGIDVTVRYFSHALKRNRIKTDIRREIHKRISKSVDINFAYPHAEVLLREKKS